MLFYVVICCATFKDYNHQNCCTLVCICLPLKDTKGEGREIRTPHYNYKGLEQSISIETGTWKGELARPNLHMLQYLQMEMEEQCLGGNLTACQ